jgi:hypothetical protein
MSERIEDVAPAVRTGDPSGPYRRRIRLERRGPDAVWGGLEDDFHHFEVTLRHDGTSVTRVEMHAVRWPWATCPAAGENLHALEGMALSERCTAVADVADPRLNCTHQFDLAGLCVTHAARGLDVRQYDVEIPTPAEDGSLVPRLWRDGELVHEWRLEVTETGWRQLVSPEPFTQAPWKGGFIKWADRNMEPDAAEAAIVLRRSCDIGMGRGMDLEAIPVASELGPIMEGICYSMQTAVMPVAFRNYGSIRDFADHPDALLSGSDEPPRD